MTVSSGNVLHFIFLTKFLHFCRHVLATATVASTVSLVTFPALLTVGTIFLSGDCFFALCPVKAKKVIFQPLGSKLIVT